MDHRGLQDPHRMNPGPSLDKCFTDYFRRCHDIDPPQPKLALPVTMVRWVPEQAAHHPDEPWCVAVADLVTLAFFFFLWVGECTAQSGKPAPSLSARWISKCGPVTPRWLRTHPRPCGSPPQLSPFSGQQKEWTQECYLASHCH